MELKSKNAIFTICAKNYLAQAKTLGFSLRKFAPEIDFYIILSDEIGTDTIDYAGFEIIEAKTLHNIPFFYELAFKYDVIEFSTAVKPFFLDLLINEKGYTKVLYIDPDMVVYSSLDFLFEALDKQDALLTPHLLYPYIKYEGATREEELLFVGIYNLGFFGINNSVNGKHIIEWWKVKLKDQCFADKEDGLHVDQKWMDFLPALFGEKVLILRHPGINLAFWNMHERVFVDNGKEYTVDGAPLVIFHFSGLDPLNYQEIARKQTKFNLTNLPQYTRLFKEYVTELKSNQFNYLSTLIYRYNKFDNQVHILKYQRRLYRSLLNEGYQFANPFQTGANTLYALLDSNKLIIQDKQGKYMALKKGITDFNAKVSKMQFLLLCCKKLIGIKYYYLLMRFMEVYARFEKQSFLIKKGNQL